MWQAVLFALSLTFTSGLVVVSVVRFFLLKSSREAPVFRLKPPRARSVESQVGEQETCRWLSVVLDELKAIYLDPLQADGRLRQLVEKKLNKDGRAVKLNALDIGESLPELKGVLAKYDGDAGELTLDASVVYSGSFAVDVTAQCAVGQRGVGRCVVPVECAASNITLEMDLRLTWDFVRNTSRFAVSFVRKPSTSMTTSLSLGVGSKAIDMPYVVEVLSTNINLVVESLVHPNALRWASPSAPSFLRRDLPCKSPESMHADTPRTARRRKSNAPVQPHGTAAASGTPSATKVDPAKTLR